MARFPPKRTRVSLDRQVRLNSREFVLHLKVFFGKAPVPSDGYGYGKAEALLGYSPMDTLAGSYRASL